MIEAKQKKGFDYYLSKEVIDDFRKTPMELRLQRLYMGSLLRMAYDATIIETQNKFREGKK